VIGWRAGRAVGSVDIGRHPPLLRLLGSAGAVGPTGAVAVAAVGPTGALASQPVATLGPADDGQARVVGRRAWLSLFSSTTTLAAKVAYCSSRRTHSYSCAGDRSRAGRAPGLRATNTGSRVQVAGRPMRWRAASMARWRTAWGLRAGIPRPWRVKVLRSDGHVAPSSAAAALTLPSRSANAKARSASAQSVRNRLGCQPRGTSAGDQLALGTAGGAAVAWHIVPDRLL
jgi:hypothetical protein